jgi:hypothetical protein
MDINIWIRRQRKCAANINAMQCCKVYGLRLGDLGLEERTSAEQMQEMAMARKQAVRFLSALRTRRRRRCGVSIVVAHVPSHANTQASLGVIT